MLPDSLLVVLRVCILVEDAKNLIRMLLKMNPRDRYTAEQECSHPTVAFMQCRSMLALFLSTFVCMLLWPPLQFNSNPWRAAEVDSTLVGSQSASTLVADCGASQALNHEWIKNKAPKAQGVSLQSNFVDNLRSF
eukprot:991589-Amphidinium_carterae.1